MCVFIIEPSEKQKSINGLNQFVQVVTKKLQQYGIALNLVNSSNVKRMKSQLDAKSLVIVFNGANSPDVNDKTADDITSFLNTAMEKEAEIWPIAMNKSLRMPMSIISQKQSYDVWEELRCRGLDENQISSVAMSFSRKLISEILPTLYNKNGEIFISHRRLDGEEAAARICDKIEIQARDAHPFRDVVKVKVGQEAQAVIDEEMENSEIFIFIHTEQAAESDWILKELRFAVLRNIPILWIQIDDAKIENLKIQPSEEPHLHYTNEELEDDIRLTKIVDKILHKAFEIIMANSDQVFDYMEAIKKLFGSKVVPKDSRKMIYHVSMERKGYHYPQRNIEQSFQVFGRTPTPEDAKALEELKNKFPEYDKDDSIVILSDKVLTASKRESIIIDSIEDFYYHWSTYIHGKKGRSKVETGEIVISGAFPECDEIYKQSLTYALIIFAKAIMKEGYILTFGAHPTFQELFFEVAKEIDGEMAKNRVKMFISDYYLDGDRDREKYYKDNCQLIRCEKKQGSNESLSLMRKNMIQRPEVKALVCLGGKVKTNKNEEGIREEINLAVENNTPAFIVGSVGGCSAKVAMEYEKEGWKDLNKAPEELNEEFLNSIDYFKLAQSMLEFIKN